MAVVTFKKEDLFNLVGREIIDDELELVIPLMGTPLEKCTKDEVEFEIFPNRPDLISVEGFARALRGYLGMQEGIATYETKKSEFEIKVDLSLSNIRPK